MADESLHQTKTCTKCGEAKPATLEFFYRHPEGRFGVHAECRVCNRARQKRRQHRVSAEKEAARMKVAAGSRICRSCLVEQDEAAFALVLSRGKKIRRARCNRCRAEENRARLRKRYAEDRAGVLARNREWKIHNAAKASAATARWIKRNPEARKATTDRYRAKRLAAEGVYTANDVRDLLKLQGRRCYYCGEKLKLYHVDHFVPIARGGSNWPTNIVIACEPCNYDKRARLPWEWKPERFTPDCSPR